MAKATPNPDKPDLPAYDSAEMVPKIPDVAEPFLAFRSWVFDPQRRMLRSVVVGGIWWVPGLDLHAVCPGRKHAAAELHCSCGIYGTREIPWALPYTGIGHAFGLVWMWGENCVPHEGGYRAEFARPAALFDVVPEVSLPRARLQRLAESYQVPLVRSHTLDVEAYRLLLRDGGDIDAELRKLLGDDGKPT